VADHRAPPGTAVECRSCKRLIVWTRTSKGKLMPMDVAPAADGKFFMFRVRDAIDAVYADGDDPRVAKALERGDKRYQSHYVSCPHGDQWRKR